jgi:hypothetical protein
MGLFFVGLKFITCLCFTNIKTLFYNNYFIHLQYYKWNLEIDQGRMPEGIDEMLQELGVVKQEETKKF